MFLNKTTFTLIMLVQVFLLPAQDFHPLIATDKEDRSYYAEIFRGNHILALIRTAAKIPTSLDTLNYTLLVKQLALVQDSYSQLNLYNNDLNLIETHTFYSTKDSIIIYQNMTISNEKKEVYLWGSLFTPFNKTKQLLILDFDLKEQQKVVFNNSIDFNFVDAGVYNHFIINNFGNLVTATKNGLIELDLASNLINSTNRAEGLFGLNFYQNHVNKYIAPSNEGYYICDSTFQNFDFKFTRELFYLAATHVTSKYKFSQNNTFFLFQTLADVNENCNNIIRGSNDVILKFNTKTYEYYPFFIDSISECTKKRLGAFGLDFYYDDFVYLINKYPDCGFINLNNIDSTNICTSEFINVKCIDQEGQLRWSKDFGGDAAYLPTGLVALPDSGSIVFVKRNEREINTAFEGDIYYTKLDKHGNMVKPITIAINESNLTLNTLQLYPNPAHHQIYIQQSGNKQLQLNLYDLNGRLILSQKIRNQESMNIEHLPIGYYAYTIQEETSTKRQSGKLLKWQ